jgi:hypothetical protein
VPSILPATALALLLSVLPPAAGFAYAPDAPGRHAVPVRYGLLWLEIDPSDAHIALDGEFLDRGVWLISMAPGLHDLAVRKPGYRPWHRRVGIGPGEKLKIAVRLEADSSK